MRCKDLENVHVRQTDRQKDRQTTDKKSTYVVMCGTSLRVDLPRQCLCLLVVVLLPALCLSLAVCRSCSFAWCWLTGWSPVVLAAAGSTPAASVAYSQSRSRALWGCTTAACNAVAESRSSPEQLVSASAVVSTSVCVPIDPANRCVPATSK